MLYHVWPGNTILGKGLGEEITYIKDNAKYYIILIKPTISLSTKEMFKIYDEAKNVVQKNNTKGMVQALEQNNVFNISRNLYNVFEETIKDKKEIFECKELLLKSGAKGVLMTGSGSSVFGIFEDKQIAKEIYYRMRKNKEAYFCISYHSNKFKELK